MRKHDNWLLGRCLEEKKVDHVIAEKDEEIDLLKDADDESVWVLQEWFVTVPRVSIAMAIRALRYCSHSNKGTDSVVNHVKCPMKEFVFF
jgi:hypothetical protein